MQGVGNQHGHREHGPSHCASVDDDDFVAVAPKVERAKKDPWLHPDAIRHVKIRTKS